MKRYASALLAAVAIFLNNTAMAQTYIGGYGGIRCSDFRALGSNGKEILDSTWTWMLGYVSGLNMIWKNVKGTDPLIRADAKEVLAYTVHYCKANPHRNVLNAVNDYWFSLPK
ncbi:MAG: HdeA family protein [Alphaproteobacteria bacterium]|nr:HdeA family protein [Alphaproteobacteria bacterium]